MPTKKQLTDMSVADLKKHAEYARLNPAWVKKTFGVTKAKLSQEQLVKALASKAKDAKLSAAACEKTVKAARKTRKSPAKKSGAKKSSTRKSGARKSPARKSPAKKSMTSSYKKRLLTPSYKKLRKELGLPAITKRRSPAKKSSTKKSSTKKSSTKKSGARKSPARKLTASHKKLLRETAAIRKNLSKRLKKSSAKKSGAKKSPAKKRGRPAKKN